MNKKFLSWVFYDKTQRCKHFFRIMKLTTVCSFALAFSLYAGNSNSQNIKVTVKQNNAELRDVLNTIEKQTDYLFVYDKYVDVNRKVSVNSQKRPLEEVLGELFGETGIKYTVDGAYIVLSSNSKSENSIALISQQNRQITGIVKDATGEPVIGANVVEKGTTNGTITDVEGRFSLSVAPNATLIISYIGYVSSEISVKGQTSVAVTLKEDSETLDEVVVVAYGTQKRSNLTGSVDVVSSKELANRPVTNTSSMLQGKASSITFSTPSGGNTPGKTPTIQIRGQAALNESTPPLVVIDGIPSSMDDFNALNPNDVESISVLKDAAASAVYGARAPYGVLMVTTKMGRRNEKPSITYSGNYGVVTPINMPRMADSYTFGLLKNQSKVNAKMPVAFTNDQLDLILDNIQNPGKYTLSDLVSDEGNTWGWGNQSYCNNDFIDIWLRSSFRHQHDLSVRGGNDKTSYSVSTGYVYQPGILNFVEDIDNYSRFNINGGVETDVTSWLKLTYRSRYSYETTKDPNFEYGQGRSRAYEFAYGAWPVTPVKNPDGVYNEGTRIATGIGGGHQTTVYHRLDNILALDFNLAKGWTAHVDGTWRMNFKDYQSLKMPVYGLRPSGDKFLMGGTESSLAKHTGMTRYWTIQGYTAYEHQIKKHNIRIQLGAQAEENTYRELSGTAKDLFVPDMDAVSIAQGIRTFDDKINDWATAGFFGRINYNFDERYFIELNGRYDGSGRYSKGSQWGFFPSAFAAWNMSNESFWEGLKDVINFAKLKTSYGTLGNQGNSAGYLHIPTMEVASESKWIFNGSRLPYVKTPGILNMSRTWEKITTLDVGLEMRALDSRLSAELGYFNRRSWDIIGPPTPKAAVLGTSAPSINNAEFVTNGFEMQLSWRDQINEQWDYGVSLNLADGRSKVTKYNSASNSFGQNSDGSEKWYEGKVFGEIWGYKVDRFLTKDDFDENGKLLVDQSKIHANWYPGDVKYEDLNGDGEITPGNSTVEEPGDLRVIGNSTPRFRYGINLSTGYEFEKAGRLDLSLFFEGVAKRDLFMNGSFFFWGTGVGNSFASSVYDNKWHMDFYRDGTTDSRLLEYMGENINSYFPRPYDNAEGNKNFQTNTKYLLNGAYLRLKNLQLAYTLPKHLISKAGITNCRVYFSGENMFVLSALPSYIDPEAVGGGRMYPQQAVYSFGVNVSF
ncbi:TonB-dependent receptor [Parabacteroides segnis]|uniref:TonB-dependent receptor n=1 Tax=Parabacteroides segnis TaxID=2763058 RepID=UPI003512936B